MIMDICIHASDLSTPTRKFDTLKEWTYLLYEEFFLQGDDEKAHDMPASFLCDRETVKVSKMQAGFLNFVVIPTWNLVTTVFPATEPLLIRAKENVSNWENYEETKEDEQVYVKKPKKIVVPSLVAAAFSNVTPGNLVIPVGPLSLNKTRSTLDAYLEENDDYFNSFLTKLAPPKKN